MILEMIYKERKNTDSKKWDDIKKNYGCEELLPLSIADMDFSISKNITESLHEYIDREIWSYRY